MTRAFENFERNMEVGELCLENFADTRHEFALRYVWVVAVSALDLYMTELVTEAGLRLIDQAPPRLTANLKQVEVPLGSVVELDQLGPTDRLLLYRNQIYLYFQFKSLYRPDKISEALRFIWTCPAKEKWSRIIRRMRETGRYLDRSEEQIRSELTLIADRRDLIAHSVDTAPGTTAPNPVSEEDAKLVWDFVCDFCRAIDSETEAQLVN